MVAKEKVAGRLQLHSDQGGQYKSQAYFSPTQEYGIKPSMSRRWKPLRLIPGGNFFHAQNGVNRPPEPPAFEQAQILIDDYPFYNFKSIQLKYRLTPFQKRSQAA